MSHFDNLEVIIFHQGLEQTAPAAAIAVYHHDELVLERAYGFLDPDRRDWPVLPSTLFDLASVTKLFTTTVFLQQVAAGQVALNDPVVRFVPEFGAAGLRPVGGGQDPHTLEPLPADSDAAGQAVDPAEITFRHLLTHTSGLAPWRDLFLKVGPPPPAPGEVNPVPRAVRIARALELIGSYPFMDLPGQTVRYSDLGLILLGEAVARLAGQDHLSGVFAALFDSVQYNPPLPMRCPPTEFDRRWRQRRCQGEVHDENAASLGGIAGHAGLFGCARSVADLGRQWLRAVEGRAEDFLPAELARDAVRLHAATGEVQRGLGWARKAAQGSSAGDLFSEDSFGHTGFTGTSLWVDPQRRLVVALMTNRVYHGRDADAIMAFRPAVHDAVCRWVDSR